MYLLLSRRSSQFNSLEHLEILMKVNEVNLQYILSQIITHETTINLENIEQSNSSNKKKTKDKKKRTTIMKTKTLIEVKILHLVVVVNKDRKTKHSFEERFTILIKMII